ncbi:excinuclease ABC subunit C [Chlamydia ibidis]|uniref:UvrABC system protein C n=2 Tax=Chlamydia ibidis TaxID=1405396 RepID=S7KF52_9CHLA|nr:excinuclease ABC subunit UvrC [Chlamydia ibidis]EPP34791.1 excinuclease ABC subunit C [Chlamydia ibidis]EQM62429.1 excinuclease ABC subunit C [Chlamydia ibidis 10-1398/6]
MHVKDFSPKLIPTSAGVYLMKDSNGEVLYVGKAKNLRNRLSSYFQKEAMLNERILLVMQKTEEVDTILVSNETEALLLENNLIKKYRPKYNVLLKDDKTFFCLSISLKHTWPRIEAVRTKSISSTKNRIIFGPYVSSDACRTLLEIINQWFPLRTCSDREFSIRKRPCILYEMKRCLGPCVNLCSHEEYSETLEKAILFLKGEINEVVESLEISIQEAAKKQLFEQAEIYYRTLKLIRQAMEKQCVEKLHFHDIDAIGLYRKTHGATITVLTVRSGKLLGARHFGFTENAQEDVDLLSSFLLQYYSNNPQVPQEILLPTPLDNPELPQLLNKAKPPRLLFPKKGYGKTLLRLAYNNSKAHAETSTDQRIPYEEMKEILKISRYPSRIECYDNAHFQGIHGVGVYVVFENNTWIYKDYRTFSLSSSNNDIASLKEVLLHRFTNLTSNLPDMIVIDGGYSQYTQAKKILRELNLTGIEIVSLAKEASNHSGSLTKERLFCDEFPKGINLSPKSKLLQFFQYLRDEAHRFAISRYRKKHAKATLCPEHKIPGIGKIKRMRLLQRCKSWKRVMEASAEELSSIQGITQKDVKAIYEYKRAIEKRLNFPREK